MADQTFELYTSSATGTQVNNAAAKVAAMEETLSGTAGTIPSSAAVKNYVDGKSVDTESTLSGGVVYDISEANNGTTYANLAAALNNGNNIPASIRKGGISIKFIQSSDNKYVQYRLMSDTFNTTPTNWQGVESEIIPNSQNLIKSGGIVNAFSELTSIIKLNKTYSASNAQQLITNISIPAGTKIYVKVTSNDAVWSRFAIFGNNSAWPGQWQIDNISNGVERSLVAPVNITNIYGYLVSATTYGTLNITIRWANSLVVTEANIEANSISSSKIQDNAISTSKIANDSISTGKINDNAITTPKISDNAVVTGKIKDKQITKEKVSFISSKNLVDINALNLGKYVNINGVLADNSSYNTTDYLPVSVGTTYYCANDGASVNVRFVAFYTENKSNISAANIKIWVNNFVCPENAAFARVSFESNKTRPQIESSPITEYHPYKDLIDSNLLPDVVIPDGAVSTSKLANGAVTQDKIADGVSFAPTPPKFKGFSVSNNALTNGEQLYTSTVEVPKQVNLTTIIKGTITSVLVGIAKGDFYGEYVEITSTQVKVYKGTGTTPSDTYNHGLTLTNNTVISIIKGNESGATVKLITDKGDIFSQQIEWLGIVGKAFVENNNGSDTIDVQLSFFLKDITKKVWLFGDSYYNIYDNKRWPWYLVSWGFTNYLIDAKGGQSAAPALSDFQNLLSLGSRPSFVLWGLGMNAGSDENNTVNATWLANTQSFLALCEQYSITPILATIPTVPSGAHAKLNEWVRNSGYRYIDFAAAVETSGSNHWKYWDTDDALLSSDEVHPTAKGAAVLASQAILDFQEMTLAAD